MTINVGDQVIWTNLSGSHNVNGNQGTFPGNPVSFGNNVGSGWTYSFTFNTAGTYNYQCDPHSGLMMGNIQVVSPSSITEAAIPALYVYPNPASGKLYLKIEGQSFSNDENLLLEIHTINGQLAAQIPLSFDAKSATSIDVSDLESGVYIYSLRSDTNDPIRGKLIIQ